MRTHVVAPITLEGFRNNENNCPIAFNVGLSDDDILRPRANEKTIRFSRRSTGLRYIFATPEEAVAFIAATDAKETPTPFVLKLTDKELLSVKEIAKQDPAKRLEKARANAMRPARPKKRIAYRPPS